MDVRCYVTSLLGVQRQLADLTVWKYNSYKIEMLGDEQLVNKLPLFQNSGSLFCNSRSFFVALASPKLLSTRKNSNIFGFSLVFS